MSKKCPLCKITSLFRPKSEKVFYEDSYVIIVRTKKLKGHKERIMIVTKGHRKHPPKWLHDYCMGKLTERGKKIFHYTPKFVIMDGTFASIKNHFHLVCTDLDPKSDDFEQILRTHWLKVVDVS